jgi:cytochrome c oxidase subunit III
MKKEFDDELTPVQREKMKKNLVYIGIFSVIMIFAGLTSGYIVSMSKSFWVKYDFPQAFWISTGLIVLSSIVLGIGIKMAQKQQKPQLLKVFVPLTFLLGLGFAWSQWIGYGQLIDEGAYLSSKITVYEGRYGSFYQLKADGKYMDVDGSRYLIAGKEMPASMKADIAQFAAQLDSIEFDKPPFDIKNYGKYTLLYKNEEVTLKDGRFYVKDTVELLFTDLNRMAEFAMHLRDGRGDFFHKGELGKDFHVYYNGNELQYKNRQIHYKGKKLDNLMQMRINDSADTATSYLYIITFLHLLHIIGTLIYMLRMSILSFTGDLGRHNYLSIRTGAIFWHFLGVLWLYLLLFLLFIH